MMKPYLDNTRFPLMALGMIALLTALWSGLLRLGWGLPLPHAAWPMAHGPLMVCGFLGTLIGVERAIALGSFWPYIGPIFTTMGTLALLAGLPAALFMMLGSLSLVVVFAVIVSRQAILATAVMALGACLWLLGNVLWVAEWPLFRVVPWWGGFLILTIAGERLELSRVLRLSKLHQLLFGLSVGLLVSGLVLSLELHHAGMRISGTGMLALSWWLLRYDIARRTVRQSGVTRFIAICLLSGYVWLGVGGVLNWRFGGISAGPYYDAILHAVFVGFVFAMIFGHAPIVLPAALGKTAVYRPIFYAPLILLQASLLLRVASDLTGQSSGRQWGGLLNAVAVLGFLGTMAVTALLQSPTKTGNLPDR